MFKTRKFVGFIALDPPEASWQSRHLQVREDVNQLGVGSAKWLVDSLMGPTR
jgi:hypothetical protein